MVARFPFLYQNMPGNYPRLHARPLYYNFTVVNDYTFAIGLFQHNSIAVDETLSIPHQS